MERQDSGDIKLGHLIVIALLLILLLSGCATPPKSIPAEPPEPSQELLAEVPFTLPEEGPTEAWQKARRYFFAAHMLQLQGNLTEAVEQYQRSIDIFPTAEAYTFLGWTYSWMGRYDDAIREAKQAIALDPDYGNPYNDIGMYLINQGSLDEAIPWLNQAIEAKRYASPHFPWLNLGLIWILKDEWSKALFSYQEARRLTPDSPIPPVPTWSAAPFLALGSDREPGTPTKQQEVKAAVAQYFDAWNTLNANALRGCSEPPSTEATQMLLMHLAGAKHDDTNITTHDSRVLHLKSGIAVVETDVVIAGRSDKIQHLLRETNGTWKVVIQLSSSPEVSG